MSEFEDFTDAPLVHLAEDPDVREVHGQLAKLLEEYVFDPNARTEIYQFVVSEFQATVSEAAVTAYREEMRRFGE